MYMIYVYSFMKMSLNVISAGIHAILLNCKDFMNIINCYWSMFFISQELILSAVGLEHIDVGGFCGLKQISILKAGDNHLASPPPLCPLKCSLETLDLSSNDIAQFSKTFLMGFSKLRNINFGDNQIFQPPDLHWVLGTLHNVKAQGNKIQSLDAFHTDDHFK